MHELLRLAIVGALALLVHAYGHDVESYMSDLGLRRWEAIIISIMILLITYFFLDMFLYRFTHLPGLRKLFHPNSRLEGYWYQIVGIGARPHSISQIKHNFLGRTWYYEGYGYSDKFELATHWRGKHIEFRDDRWLFGETVEHLTSNGDIVGHSHAVTVLYTKTYSPAFREGKHMYGRAIDMDFGEDEEAIGFKLELIMVSKADCPESLKLDPVRAAKLFFNLQEKAGK
jgi:hypothetical protein